MTLVGCLNLKNCRVIVELQEEHSCTSMCSDGLHYGLCTNCSEEIVSELFDEGFYAYLVAKGRITLPPWRKESHKFVSV